MFPSRRIRLLCGAIAMGVACGLAGRAPEGPDARADAHSDADAARAGLVFAEQGGRARAAAAALREPLRQLLEDLPRRGGRSRRRRRGRGARRGDRDGPRPSPGRSRDRVHLAHAPALREPDLRGVPAEQVRRVEPAARGPPAAALHAERRPGQVRRALRLPDGALPLRRPPADRARDRPRRRAAPAGGPGLPARARAARNDVHGRRAARRARRRDRAGRHHAADRRGHVHQQGAAGALSQLHARHELRLRRAEIPHPLREPRARVERARGPGPLLLGPRAPVHVRPRRRAPAGAAEEGGSLGPRSRSRS